LLENDPTVRQNVALPLDEHSRLRGISHMNRILLIDDDDLVRETLTRSLRDAGFETESVATGQLAIQLLMSQPFDLVVTDIIMPDCDGIETINQITKGWPGLKIIAISGGGLGSANLYLSTAEGLGANLTLTKPFRPSELVRAIERCLGRGNV
jgi:CheY-like chemotaxis protein